MNICFHILTGLTMATAVTAGLHSKPSFKGNSSNNKSPILTYLMIIFTGITMHALLDYMPHQYYISAKVDVIIGCVIFIIAALLFKKQARWIYIWSLIGVLLPDLIDLGPQILLKLTGVKLPIKQKLFPWHWTTFSGSIYQNEMHWVSLINHLLITVSCIGYLIIKRNILKVATK